MTIQEATSYLKANAARNKILGMKAVIISTKDDVNYSVRWYSSEVSYRADLSRRRVVTHGILK